MTEVHLRYCPGCREEYQPHMTRCVECGTALQDTPPEPEQTPEASLPPGEYHRLVGSLSTSTLARLMGRFRAAGIPVKLEPDLSLSVRLEDHPAAIALLERQGVVPKQPDASAPAVSADGGPCPACGADVRPGQKDCPGCGLQLGADPVCEGCGGELSPADAVCPACGLPPE